MHNPYQPPEVASEPVGRVRNDAPLIWFAGPMVGLLYADVCWQRFMYFEELGALETALELLQFAGRLAIPAVIVYAAMRYVFRSRFDYESTRLSLVIAGLVAAGYLIVVERLHWQRFDDIALWVGVLIGVPFAYALAALEQWIASKKSPKLNEQESQGVTTGVQHASIMWFAGAILSATVVMGAIENPSILSNPKMLDIAAMICLIATFPYALISVCIHRRRPATVAARITAAIAFMGTFLVAGYTITAYWPMNGIILIMIMIGAAVVAVGGDRLVTRWSSKSLAESD